MGLPAFDMSAFEAAQEAVKPTPRASTSIILGPGVKFHAEEDVHRIGIRKAIDEAISGLDEWRSNAFSGTALMRGALREGLHQVPLAYVGKLSADFVSNIRELTELAEADWKNDQEVLLVLRQGADEAATISVHASKFLRRETKRLEQVAIRRRETYNQLNISLGQMLKQMTDILRRNSISPPAFGDDTARSNYVENSFARAADLSGVAERTRRRLKQFPKVASYLAR